MATNIHLAHASDVITDEHGSYADVACGAVGSYYSTDRADVTCADCLASPTPFQVSCGAATYEQGHAEGIADRAIGRILAESVRSAGSADWQHGYLAAVTS